MNLVIGSSSQLAQYFPKDYIKISSRNIDFSYLRNNNWNNVYITFAEQRIYDANIDYITPNYIYTLQIINSLLSNCDKIVCYTSCELWNDLSGVITINSPPKFSPLNNEYSLSKLLLWNKILELRKINTIYNKVIFMHPFYFNSTYRNSYFLFGKIFSSIVNRQKIQVGNLDFYRDMIHAKFAVQKSIESTQDTMLGSGQLFHIRKFVKDLYKLNNMDFYDFVQENMTHNLGKSKLIMAHVNWEYSYQNLLDDTRQDILNIHTNANTYI